ncbi:MAG: hypothetical protein M4579_002026 [Chaenotheca gracillima]|nr:MAG: hypothetical protein M4579_002026 [Chaenotheca gracillima]
MPDDDNQHQQQPEHSRFLSKGHWKNKIRAKYEQAQHRETQRAAPEDQLSDFLRPSSRDTSTSPASKPPSAPRLPQLGRLDTAAASRWPTASELKSIDGGLGGEGRAGRSPGPAPRRPKRNRKGLTVGFVDTAPEIIGEGGDEAEAPPIEISRLRAQLRTGQTHLGSRHEGDPRGGPRLGAPEPQQRIHSRSPSRPQDDEAGFVPPRMTRKPTGFGEVAELQREPRLPVLDDEIHHSPASGREKGTFSMVQAKMRAEEGKALSANPNVTPSLEVENVSRPQSQDDVGSTRARGLSQSPSRGIRDRSPRPAPQHLPSKPLPSTLLPHHLKPGSSQSGDVSPVEHHPLLPPTYFKPPATSSVQDVSPPPSRGNSSSGGNEALEDFSARTQLLSVRFRHLAESVKPIFETPFVDWIRAAAWWFLKGRVSLESAIRRHKASAVQKGAQLSPSKVPLQAYINLAKAWWILQQISAQHPEPRRYGAGPLSSLVEAARRAGDETTALQVETHQALVSNLRAVTMSMKRNGLQPPDLDHDTAAAEGVDMAIWILYPRFQPDICAALSGSASRSYVISGPTTSPSLSDVMPLADSRERFSYGRLFANAFLVDENDDMPDYEIPCVVSMVRGRNEKSLTVVLASQSELLNIEISPSKNAKTSWDDVRWRQGQYQVFVKITRDITLAVHFSEQDYKSLKDTFDVMENVNDNLIPRTDEELIFKSTPDLFQYDDSVPPSTRFPSGPLHRCDVRLFERIHKHTDGLGTRKYHRGFRILIVTGPEIKQSAALSFDLGKQSPIEFGLLRGEGGEAAALLRAGSGDRKSSMILTFHEAEERAAFLSSLQGTFVRSREKCLVQIPLNGLSVTTSAASEGSVQNGGQRSPFDAFEWQQIQVINTLSSKDGEFGETVSSDHLRLCATSKLGTIVDRINLGPGQLLLELDHTLTPGLKLLRARQEDFTISIAENAVSGPHRQAIRDLQQNIFTSETIRNFTFPSLNDLHSFQEALTNFSVLYDGTATIFAISRRRMVVPIHKRWEASGTRIQVLLRRDKKIAQLIAFFGAGFSHGRCMNFVLKGTDVYESLAKSGKFTTRLVDAKFALPKGPGSDSDVTTSGNESASARGFVCLDLPEYPGEHDDINITFGTAEGEVLTGSLWYAANSRTDK